MSHFETLPQSYILIKKAIKKVSRQRSVEVCDHNCHLYNQQQISMPVFGQNEVTVFDTSPPCHVMPVDNFEADTTVLINILESFGPQVDQLTEPPELPVSGEPGTYYSYQQVYN